jgi:hypothetical protein
MESEHVRQEVYQIVVKGHLDSEWSDWFDGLTITLVDHGETILTGPIVDQTALHVVLIKRRVNSRRPNQYQAVPKPRVWRMDQESRTHSVRSMTLGCAAPVST